MPDSIVSRSRVDDAELATLPREVISRLLFAACQCRGRLEHHTTRVRSKVDAALIAECRDAVVALQAALDLSRQR